MRVRIHTAGAAQGSPGPGGYGAVLMPFQNPVVVCGNNVSTNEEEMGLRAIVEGITQVWTIFGNEIGEKSINIHSSSRSVMDAARAAVQNPAGNKGKIWQELAQVTEELNVNFIHDDHEENRHAQRIADHLAETEAPMDRFAYRIPLIMEGPHPLTEERTFQLRFEISRPEPKKKPRKVRKPKHSPGASPSHPPRAIAL